jgi:hypothetical protein
VLGRQRQRQKGIVGRLCRPDAVKAGGFSGGAQRKYSVDKTNRDDNSRLSLFLLLYCL